MTLDNSRWMAVRKHGVMAFIASLEGDPDHAQPDDYLSQLDEDQREQVREAAAELVGIIDNMRGAG